MSTSILLFWFILIQFAGAAVITHQPPNLLLLLPNEGISDTRYDLNSDGTEDIRIGGLDIVGPVLITSAANRYLAVPAVSPNLGGEVLPLGENSMIGPSLPMGLAWLNTDVTDGFIAPEEGDAFVPLITCLNNGCTGSFYPGFETLRAFVGIEFEANDGTHYGYLDITIPPRGRGGFINGWAYESEPGKSITTRFIPEPSIAMTTLLGIFSFSLRRRRI